MALCKCGGTAVVRLEYAQADYCGSCFCELFESRVAKANREFGLLRRGDVVAVGVSGGKDSAAMLFSFNKLAQKIGEIALKPVLVDEGIAGYRNRAAECAEKLCDRLGLRLERMSYKQALGTSMDEVMRMEAGVRLHASCSYCGVFRKYCLNKAAREAGANKLAIGHNADDVAQTFLMNLLRNEPQRNEQFGVFTGSGERTQFVPRVRPLAYCLEIECAYYCVFNKIPFYRGGCPYAGESFRVEVKDFLNSLEERHPGTKNALLKSALNAKSEREPKQEAGKESGGQKILLCEKCGEYAGESSRGLCRACELVEEIASAGYRPAGGG